jgi:phage RecT family recombinase
MNDTKERLPVLIGEIERREADYSRVLPPSVPVGRFIAAARTALITNPELVECTKQSLVIACSKCATDGLVPDGREAAMVVGKVKRGGQWVKEAQYWAMTNGLMKIAFRSGRVLRLEARVVYEKDEFRLVYGTRPDIVHAPAIFAKGAALGCYCVASLTGGLQYVEFMDLAECQGIMRRSKSYDRETNTPKGPWRTDFDEMMRKTVLRRALKYIPTVRTEDEGEGDPDTAEAEVQVGAIGFQRQHALPGGEITSGRAETPIDAEDAQDVADAEMLDMDALPQPAPAPTPEGPPEHATSRKDDWSAKLEELRVAVGNAGSRDAVEEVWMEWDTDADDPPAEVAQQSKAIVDERLQQLAYAQAKGR